MISLNFSVHYILVHNYSTRIHLLTVIWLFFFFLTYVLFPRQSKFTILEQKNSMFLGSMEKAEWMSLQRPHSHKDSKRNPLLFVWIWIHTSGITVVNSLFVHFLDMIKNRAVRAAASPRWDSFERSLIYTVCIYPWEALCGEEEWNKTAKDKCQGCCWGTMRRAAFPICGVLLHLLAEMCLPVCKEEDDAVCGSDKGWDLGEMMERSQFVLGLGRLLLHLAQQRLTSWCRIVSVHWCPCWVFHCSLLLQFLLPSELQNEPLDSTRFS